MTDQTSFRPRTQTAGSRRVPVATLLAAALLLTQAATAGAQVFTRGNVLLTSPHDTQNTGRVMASADFDGDGFADLAVGAPLTTAGGVQVAGEVLVWYGSPSGFGTAAVFYQGLGGLPGTAEEADEFGASVAAGDFDGDGFADLAVGVPLEDIPSGTGPLQDAGVVEVIYGSTGGLVTSGAQVFNQESPGIGGQVESDDGFGAVLSTGDFNADGFADLAIGTPGENVGAAVDAGNLSILFGTAGGLTGIGSETFNEAGAGGTVAAGNQFGRALAAGDFDGDSHADLAVGAPTETVNGHPSAGAVWIFSGVDGGLSVPGLFVHQGVVLPSGTVAGVAETDDTFGFTLAAGDFNRTNAQSPSYDELAIGVIGEDDIAGAVEILAGSVTGITAVNSAIFRENDLTGTGTSIYFGWSLAAGSLHSSVRDDLVVGSPYDDLNGPGTGGGRIFVLPGSSQGGLYLPLVAEFDGSTPGLACGPPNSGEGFGGALAIGNYDGREVQDLAVGLPGLNPNHDNSIEGAVEVLWSALFASDFETGNFSQWSIFAP